MCYQIPGLTPYGLQEARRQLCLPTSGVMGNFQGMLRSRMGMERRNHKSEPQGTQSYLSRQEELRVWLKSTEPQGRTSNVCLTWTFLPQGYWQHWRDSIFLLLSHLFFILWSEEFNRRQLPHMAFFPCKNELWEHSGVFRVHTAPKDLREELALDTTSWNITMIAPAGDVYNKNWMLQHELHTYLSSWFIHQK